MKRLLLLTCLLVLLTSVSAQDFDAYGTSSLEATFCETFQSNLTIQNTGNETSEYRISVDGSAADWVMFSSLGFELVPEQAARITAFYNIPCDAEPALYDLDIYFDDGYNEKVLSQEITVNKPDNLGLVAQPLLTSIPPCETAVYTLTLTNPLTVVDTYTLSVQGHKAAHLSQKQLILEGEKNETIRLSVAPDECTQTGNFPLTVTASSKKGGITKQLNLDLIVTSRDIPEIGPETSRIRTDYIESSAEISIRNTGDRTTTYRLTLDGITWGDVLPRLLTLQPGETQFVSLHLAPSESQDKGTYEVVFRATVSDTGIEYSKPLTIRLAPPTLWEKNPSAVIAIIVVIAALLAGIVVLIQYISTPEFKKKYADLKKVYKERKKAWAAQAKARAKERESIRKERERERKELLREYEKQKALRLKEREQRKKDRKKLFEQRKKDKIRARAERKRERERLFKERQRQRKELKREREEERKAAALARAQLIAKLQKKREKQKKERQSLREERQKEREALKEQKRKEREAEKIKRQKEWEQYRKKTEKPLKKSIDHKADKEHKRELTRAERKARKQKERELRTEYHLVSKYDTVAGETTSRSTPILLFIIAIILLLVLLPFIQTNWPYVLLGVGLLCLASIVRLISHHSVARLGKRVLVKGQEWKLKIWRKGLSQIKITSTEALEDFKVLCRREKLSTPPSNCVAHAVTFKTNVDDKLLNIQATFSVSKQWMQANHLSSSDIRIAKQAKKWATVTAEKTGEDDDNVYYTADIKQGTYAIYAKPQVKRKKTYRKAVSSLIGIAIIIALTVVLTPDTTTVRGIPPQVWAQDRIHTVDLNKYFVDPDKDPLTFGVTKTDKITIDIIDGIAFLTPETGWTGSENVKFTASDGKGGQVQSNTVKLIVKSHIVSENVQSYLAILFSIITIILLLSVVKNIRKGR